MAPTEEVEYVYPFICGLCGFGYSNIDLFHHHFAQHSEVMPAVVFHPCEEEQEPNSLNIQSFVCGLCRHTFPSLCNLQKHFEADTATVKYLMDLESKTAYPLSISGHSVNEHSFILDADGDPVVIGKESETVFSSPKKSSTINLNKKKKQTSTKPSHQGGKTGPNNSFDTVGFENLLSEVINHKGKQRESDDEDNNEFDNMEDLDDNEASTSNISTTAEVLNLATEPPVQSRKKWPSCKICGLHFFKISALRIHYMEHYTDEGQLKYKPENMCRCDICGFVMLKDKLYRHKCTVRRMNLKAGLKKLNPVGQIRNVSMVRCQYCSKTIRRYMLAMHIRSTHKKLEPVECPICKKTLASKFVLYKHKGNCHAKQEKKYKCDSCPMAFVTPFKLRVHSTVHTGERLYQCHVCSNRYSVKASLKRHLRNQHSGEKLAHYCSICPKWYTSKDGLGQHLRTVHGQFKTDGARRKGKPEVSKTCDHCNKTFSCGVSLRRHLNEIQGNKPFQCDKCPVKYSSKESLNRHVKRRHGSSTLIFCDKCTKVFTWPESLQKHMKRHHTGENDDFFLCGERQCRKKFKTSEELAEHSKTHQVLRKFKGVNPGRMPKSELDESTGQTIYTCDLCGLQYVEVGSFRRHRREQHGLDLPLKCSICGKTFSTKASLKSHQASVHKGEKAGWISCSVKSCRQKFPTEDELNVHMLYHQKFPLKCFACDKTFSTTTTLTSHMASVHAEEKMDWIKCSVKSCRQRFPTQDELNVHMLYHQSGTLSSVHNPSQEQLGSENDHSYSNHGNKTTNIESENENETPAFTAYKLTGVKINSSQSADANKSSLEKETTLNSKKTVKPKVLVVRRKEQQSKNKLSDEELANGLAVEHPVSVVETRNPVVFMVRITRDENEGGPVVETSIPSSDS